MSRACALLLALWLAAPGIPSPAWAQRTIVLGFDGLDPRLTERWMAAGKLPHFARLKDRGSYQVLPTTNPPQSPVAWASFATGLAPAAHGLFDFLARNPDTYAPEYAIARLRPPGRVLELWGWRLPLAAPVVESGRAGTPFWITVERRGLPASVLRVPTTYPPDPITRMLAGMGVPDLLGTQGTYTLYSTAPPARRGGQGRWVRVEAREGRIETVLAGPPHPLGGGPLTVPLSIAERGPGRVAITLGGKELELAQGAWSDWVEVAFPYLGLFAVRGLVRLYLVEGFPEPTLYLSPIQIDPEKPAVPLSSPPDYAAELAARIGRYHTIGMPEETSSLNAEDLPDAAWLALVRTILAEREAMLYDLLARQKTGLIAAVFVQPDRVQHMFWRGLDPLHPRHADTDPAVRDAVLWIYQESDRILGEVLARMGPRDRLIVLSDHGFTDYRRSVHVNRLLLEGGWLRLKAGARSSEPPFRAVDWPRTRAYALGFNGIFLNRRGREALGVVDEAEAEALKEEIRTALLALTDPRTGARVVQAVYDGDALYAGPYRERAPDLVVGFAPGYRASWQTALGGVPEGPVVVDNDRKWSGDHLIDPEAVPGVLFTSFPLEVPLSGLAAVGGLVLRALEAQHPGLAAAAPPPPERGWLDLPAPALAALDGALAPLPPLGRLVLWSALAAALSMLLYRLLSPQRRLHALAERGRELQRRLRAFDGELGALWPLLGRSLAVSFARLALTLPAALAASLPLLAVLAFLSNRFDARLPEVGEPVEVRIVPDPGRPPPPVRWTGGEVERLAPDRFRLNWPAPERPLALYDSDGTLLLRLPLAAPVREIAERAWWNALIGNPAGYLPSPGTLAAVELALPRPDFLPFGPDWLRGWLAPALAVMLLASLGLKLRWRLR